MKRYLKYLLSLLILVLVLGVLKIPSDAAEGNGASGNDVINNKPATELQSGSISKNKTGWIFYITDSTHHTKTPIYFVPYMRPSGNLDTTYVHARDHDRSSVVECPFTLKELIADYTGGAVQWNSPAFQITGISVGSGNDLKSHFLSYPNGDITKDQYIMNFVTALFDNGNPQGSVRQDILDNYEDRYLIVEAVMWQGRKASDSKNYLVSVPYWWQAFSPTGDTSKFGSSTARRQFAHSMYIPETWGILKGESPNWNGLEAVDALMNPTCGFGIMMFRFSGTPEEEETPQPPSITVTNTNDYLRANELNYVFADIKTDSSAMREADTYDDATFGINAELESIWKKHVGADDRNQAIKDGKWYIEETITSDIVNKLGLSNGLFYRSEAGAYFKPSDAVGLKTVIKGSGMQYAGYGYNLTRTVFNDNMVISSFSTRGDNQSMKSYVKDTLKFDVGHDGVKSNIVMTDNTEGQTSDTAQDKYTFVGKVTEYYEHNDKIHHSAEYEDEYGWTANGTWGVTGQKKVKDEWDEPNWNSYTADYTTDTKQHDVTHGLYKYTPYNITTVPNTSAGNLLLATGHIGQAYSKVSFASQQSGVLKIYPEVKYEMWYIGSTETWSTPQKKDIYVMGEKQRSCKPAIIHGYNVYIPGGSMKGQTIVDSPLTGTLANDFSNSWSADGSYQSEYEVCSQGSGFETATTNAPKIDFASFGLDLSESSINGFTPKGTWESASPLDSHMNFVFAVLGNVDSEVKMRRYNQSNQPQGQEYDMSFDISDNTISSTTKQQIKIVFENGSVTTGKTEVISAIASAYGVSSSEATTIWNNSGIEQQLREMMETSASSNNNSGNVVETPDNWYDETSECLTITVCKTTVTFGKILLSDKHDYGSSTSQSETSITSVGNGGYQCRYFYSLKFISDSINVDGFNLDVSGTKYLIHDNEIKGARFLVSNSTTSNMRK